MTSRIAILATSLALALPAATAAQNGVPAMSESERTDSLISAYPEDWGAAQAPFGPGERLTYKVKVGIFGAGTATMQVEALDSVRENPTYRAVMEIDGGILGLNVHDIYTTWFDQQTLQSWRYIRDINEVTYHSYRHYEFYPDEGIWAREDNDESGPLGSSLPLDDTAFIYFIRQMPLEVGKTYTLKRYFKEDGNPVVIQVLRRETRKVEGVEYNTLVIKPLIQTDGMFSEGGEAELHFTDDERRHLVYMKTDIPNFPGALTLHLQKIEEGIPLHPTSRAEALQGRAERAEAIAAQQGR